jgi:hypothetical protein
VRGGEHGAIHAFVEVGDESGDDSTLAFVGAVAIDMFDEPLTNEAFAQWGGATSKEVFLERAPGKYNSVPRADFQSIFDCAKHFLKGWAGTLDVTSGEAMATLETRYRDAPTIRKDIVSSRIERGGLAQAIKSKQQLTCCLCVPESSRGFAKPDGSFYIELHHVFPLSDGGVHGPSNLIPVCPTHHRQLHFGCVGVQQDATGFDFTIDGVVRRVPRLFNVAPASVLTETADTVP